MAVKTWDTSRVGGGTYELHRDATTGSYSLKSVGFDQVNKLTLPELASQDATTTTTTAKTDTAKTDTTTTTADPYKQLASANLGGDTQPDYTGSMLKTPKVKEATVRQAGDRQRLDPRDDRSPQEIQNLKNSQDIYNKATEALSRPGQFGYSKGYSDPSMQGKTLGEIQSMANEQIMSAREKYATETQYNRPQRTTGLQKIKPTLEKAKTKIQPAIAIAGKVLGGMLQAITPELSPTQKLNKSYFNVRGGSVDGQRIAGNPATDLYAGMNRTSAFGNLEKAGAKRIARREKTAATKNVSDKFKADTERMKEQQKEYKAQKTAKQKAVQGPAGGATTGGGGGGSDSGRVICTELHRTKEMTTHDWIRDIKFTYNNLSKDHIKGYLFWAVPTVNLIKKYPTYRKIWKHLAQHRANDIAWRLNQGKFDLLGRIYAGIGEPLCWLIGKCVSDKQLKELKLNSWRKA